MQDDLLIALTSLAVVYTVSILVIYRGNFPQKVLYPPKKLRIRQKVSYLCSEKLSASGNAPRPPEQGLCPCTQLREQPPDPQQSIDVHDIRTPPVFGRVVSKYYLQMCKKLQLLGTSSTRLSELCPWTTLGDFEVPIPQLP